MAAPRKKAAPPPPWWHHRWLEHRAVQAGALLTLFGLFSFIFGTTRDMAMQAWRHYTGAELAHQLAPEVSELRALTAQTAALTTRQDERATVGEQRLGKLEQTLAAVQDSKEIEQERQGAVEKTQRSACLTGELSEDACHRLGYPTVQQ